MSDKWENIKSDFMSQIKILTKPLTVNEINFRVQSINKGGYATLLAYKDARVDINRLNASFGQLGWQRKHEIIGGQLFCSVGIWNAGIGEWVWKQDVGVESRTEAQKGKASDSFKRACFNLGIGIELYSYPIIQIQLGSDEWSMPGGKPKQTWKFKLKEWVWYSEFDDKNQLVCLAAKQLINGKKRLRYKFGEFGVKK